MASQSTHVAVADLPATWRERADVFRRHGATEAAATVVALADELEATLRAVAVETLTLEEAAAASGYSTEHLARLVRSGAIPNAGRKHAPRIRRVDVPQHGTTLPNGAGAPISRAQIARSVVDSMRGHDDD